MLVYRPSGGLSTDRASQPQFGGEAGPSQPVPMAWQSSGRPVIDLDWLERQSSQSPGQLLLLCSPHNPGGTVYRREELERLADLVAERHDLLILVSDDIHCELVLDADRQSPHSDWRL